MINRKELKKKAKKVLKPQDFYTWGFSLGVRAEN